MSDTKNYVVRIKTQMSYDGLEAVLNKHCKRPFGIAFEGLEDKEGSARKIMSLSFETEQDRESFRAALSRK